MIVQVSTQRGATLRSNVPGRWFKQTEGIVIDKVWYEFETRPFKAGTVLGYQAVGYIGEYVERRACLGVVL